MRPNGILALDARIVIEPKHLRKITLPGSHLIISMYPRKYHRKVPVEARRSDPRHQARGRTALDRDDRVALAGPRSTATSARSARSPSPCWCATATSTTTPRSPWSPSEEGKKRSMLAIARITIETPNAEEGEFAIVVRDDYQRQGVGASS